MGLPYQMWFTIINEHLVYPLENSHFSMENPWKSPFCWENPQKFYGHYQWPHGYWDGPESGVQRIIPFRKIVPMNIPMMGHISQENHFSWEKRGVSIVENNFSIFLPRVETSLQRSPSCAHPAHRNHQNPAEPGPVEIFHPKKWWYNWDIEGYRIGKLIGY